MEVINPFDFFVEPYADTWPFSSPRNCSEDLTAFFGSGARGSAARRAVSLPFRATACNTVDFLVDSINGCGR